MAAPVVVTAPAPFVALDELKAQVKEETTDQDALLEIYRAAACAAIDGPAGRIGRSVGEQTLEARLDGFPAGAFALSCGPVLEIVSIKYDDPNGDEQTVDPADYQLSGDVVLLAVGASWPSAAAQIGSVRVRYSAGFEVVPAALKAAALLIGADLYSNRETVGQGAKLPTAATVDALLAPYNHALLG